MVHKLVPFVFFNLPLFLFLYIYIFDLKGLNGTCGKDTKKVMLSNFFKSNKNHDDICPFLLLTKPKPIPFSTTSSSGNKVESNSDFNHSNLAMQFVCPSGLPIYVASMADFSKIHVNT
jgi:hypothetical protein